MYDRRDCGYSVTWSSEVPPLKPICINALKTVHTDWPIATSCHDGAHLLTQRDF